jgi:hypothetical protein
VLVAGIILILYLCLNDTTILNSSGTVTFLKLLNIGTRNGDIAAVYLFLNDSDLLTVTSLLSFSRGFLISGIPLRRLVLFLLPLSINLIETLSSFLVVLIGAVSVIINTIKVIVIFVLVVAGLALLSDTLSAIF